MPKVNNLAKYAEEMPYIVARENNGSLWFWGAWDDEAEARRVAKAIGGIVVENDDIKEKVA